MPTPKQQPKLATDHDTETDQSIKDTGKEDNNTNSEGLSETLQHSDIVHVVSNIIHVRQLHSFLSTCN